MRPREGIGQVGEGITRNLFYGWQKDVDKDEIPTQEWKTSKNGSTTGPNQESL